MIDRAQVGLAVPAHVHPDRGWRRGRALIIASVAVLAMAGCASTGPTKPAVTTASSAATAASTTTARTTSASSVSTPTTSRAAASTTTRTTAPASTSHPGTAVALLATLIVKGRAPKTGYTRDAFGSAWTDDNAAPMGHNGCDTRNDILRRDLTAVVLKADSNGCAVATGILNDPYTAKRIAFVRGAATSTAVQIDHVVALSDAWQKGAQQWGAVRRVAFANDPLNLLAVDGPTNEAKSDGDAATWLPPNKAFRCTYVARQVAVKARYGLWVTAAEGATIASILSTCPGQVAPTETGTAPANPASTTTPRPGPTTVAATTAHVPATTAPASAGSVYYANCAAVRAAGKAPLLRGQPGYSSKLDRDGDGIACE